MEKLNYSHIIIRYGELNTKGKNRKVFISSLLGNIKHHLKEFPNLKYLKTHDRLFIDLNGEDYHQIYPILDCIFGLSSYSVAIKTDVDLDEIKKVCLSLVKEKDYKTFKMQTKRQDKNFYMNSGQINVAVAGYILSNHNIKVDVHNPEILIKIELRSDAAYIMSNKVKGIGGFPVGVNGKCIMMISGGIDSPVASYLTMKRGLRLECIHFESSPYTSLEAIEKVLSLVKILTKYQIQIKVHIIPFTKLQLAIYQNADESYAITIMRRMMYRIADKISSNQGILAISNGESIGQVASQTIESSYVIGKCSDKVIYRPLAMYDKMEIVDKAKEIGTYETSILPFEDCCTIFDPKNPVTKPKLSKCEFYEAKFDYETLINEAIENDDVRYINYFEKEDSYL